MKTANIAITFEEFLALRGNHPLVKKFSHDALRVLFSFNSEVGGDWEECFTQAEEKSEVAADEEEHSIQLLNGNWLVL